MAGVIDSAPAPPKSVPIPVSESVSRLVKIAPTTATPRVAPISRKKLFEEVAVPTSLCGKAFCTASTRVCMIRPMPAPISPM